ncbi:TPA: Lrp/AsnC family transcriptional regulator [Candidatus Bathyarchaeota archaeon]|nr:Lrp/AsnC family transcriptional regulator [Candidatus Bathyarchaeota archaeon]HIJ08443.1 Lrp/AsnC family transcriptional regulator [Candidatus Bathyarchaeota archaeon]
MDEIDKKIISELQADGRTTLQELAKVVGFTSMGTKKRLEKLLSKGTIRVSALVNPSALRLHPAIVMLEMESAEAMQELLDRFEECPRVIQIFKTVGGYNLIALVVAETQETLESISMEKCSLRCSRGIRRSEFYPISDMYFSPFLQIREALAHKKRAMTPCNVDCDPCKRYETQKCVGCPTTTQYKGSL